MMEQEKEKMQQIKIDSIILHCSTADEAQLDRDIKLLKLITKATPIKTLAKKRIPAWKVRPGMPLGCKVTIRKNTFELLKMLFTGVPEIHERQFNPGFLNFGIPEYIEIPSIPYDRDIGIIGFEVVVRLKRPGFRINKKKIKKGRIGSKQKITKTETMEFFKKNFDINVVNDEK